LHALSAGIAWTRLLDQAEAHGVAPLVARNLDALGWPGIPPDVRAALEAARRLNAARNLLVARVLGRALDALGRAGVPVIPLKGVALADSLYGDAGLRVSSDIDLLVPRQAVAPAFAVFAQFGYLPAAEEKPVEDGDINLLLKSNMEYAFVSQELQACPIELHWDIAWRWPEDVPALADLWADARPGWFRGVAAWALGPEWHLLYLAVHAARHRWEALKWLVDVHEICARDGLDWVRVRDKAARFGLGDVLGITLGACRTLLGTPMPPEAPARTPPAWVHLFPSTTHPQDIWQGGLYPVRLFNRPSEKLRYLARVLLVPTLGERRLVRLPAGLGALYYALRPLRLGGRWGWEVTRLALRQFGRGLAR
jgi:hypothetical protein